MYWMMDCEANRWKRETGSPAEMMSEVFCDDTPNIGTSMHNDRDTLANNR